MIVLCIERVKFIARSSVQSPYIRIAFSAKEKNTFLLSLLEDAMLSEEAERSAAVWHVKCAIPFVLATAVAAAREVIGPIGSVLWSKEEEQAWEMGYGRW